MRNPEKFLKWNPTIEQVKKEEIEDGHICKVIDIYKPSEDISKMAEISYTRYQNKSRNFYVIVSKSLDDSFNHEKDELLISMNKSSSKDSVKMNLIADFLIIMKYYKDGEEFCLLLKEMEISFPDKDCSFENGSNWLFNHLRIFSESLQEHLQKKNHHEDKSANKSKLYMSFVEEPKKEEIFPNRPSGNAFKEISVYCEGNAEFFPPKEFLLDVLDRLKKKYHEKQVLSVYHHSTRINPDPTNGGILGEIN